MGAFNKSRIAGVSALATLTLLVADPVIAERENVIDLSRAQPGAIQVGDIVEALSPERGTVIVASKPPTVMLPVYFEFDSSELRPDARLLLKKVSQAMNADLGIYRFAIEGHTDGQGSESHNRYLSLRRAESVASALEETGVPESRLQVVAWGPSKPVASNDTHEGRHRNRRVEIKNLGAPK